MLELTVTGQFRKDYKRVKKRYRDHGLPVQEPIRICLEDNRTALFSEPCKFCKNVLRKNDKNDKSVT